MLFGHMTVSKHKPMATQLQLLVANIQTRKKFGTFSVLPYWKKPGRVLTIPFLPTVKLVQANPTLFSATPAMLESFQLRVWNFSKRSMLRLTRMCGTRSPCRWSKFTWKRSRTCLCMHLREAKEICPSRTHQVACMCKVLPKLP